MQQVPLHARINPHQKRHRSCIALRMRTPPLGDACPQKIMDVDDADRHALLHDEKRRDG
jgi:hypothetical protein